MIRKNRLTFALLAVFMVLSLVLTACGGTTNKGPDENTSGETNTGTTQEPTQPAQETTKPAQDTVVIGRGGDSKALDPIQVTDGESLRVTDQIFDGLVRYKPGTTEVMPGLATEWQVSDDGMEWTFTLQSGVKFHDGTDFDANAVKYNFDRWRLTSHPEHKGGNFGYFVYQFGGFDGDSIISDVQVIDPTHVKIILSRPQAPFLQNLAMSPFGIASPTAVQKDPEGFNQAPVGTGPFKFVRWDKGDKIELEANKEYWDGAPAISKVIYRSIPDNNARLTALQSGELDMMDGIDPANLKIIEGMSDFKIVYRPANNVGYLAFNLEKAPFDDARIRKAINYAIDKEAIAQAFYGGLGEPAVTPLPPAMWGKTTDVTTYEYNPDKARELLAQAGYTKDKPLVTELWAMPVPRPYMPKPTDIAVALQGYLAEVGIDAKIVTYDWGVYLTKTGLGEHPMALLGWTGDNGDPDNFLYVLLDKDNAKGPDAGNIAFYKSDRLHELLIKAQTTNNQAERTELYVQAQKIIAEDAPWVPLMHSRVPIAIRANLTGFTPSPMSQEVLNKLKFEG